MFIYGGNKFNLFFMVRNFVCFGGVIRMVWYSLKIWECRFDSVNYFCIRYYFFEVLFVFIKGYVFNKFNIYVFIFC